MQGVQPSPNTTPSSGAPARPAAGSRWMRTSRCRPGITPMKARPEHDRQRAEHPRDDLGVAEQRRAEPAEERAAHHEHRGEAQRRTARCPSTSRPRLGSALMPVTYDR